MGATQEQSDLDCQMADYGQSVTVYTSPADATGRECTGIVSYPAPKPTQAPRGMQLGISVKLSNSATLGISGDEWDQNFEVAVPIRPGGAVGRRRTLRMLAAGRFGTWITWELG